MMRNGTKVKIVGGPHQGLIGEYRHRDRFGISVHFELFDGPFQKSFDPALVRRVNNPLDTALEHRQRYGHFVSTEHGD